MPQTDRDRTVALAGLFQAAHLVRDIARTGGYDGDDFATCIGSLFKIDAADSVDVFDGLKRIKTGLRLLTQQIKQPQDIESTRYLFGLINLERKLRRRNTLLTKLRSGIEVIEPRLEHFPPTHENTIAALADLYTETISTLRPRIMVSGEQVFLNQTDNANRIRALLLAGIRAAILWRQSGGSQFMLLLRRKAVLRTAHDLLDELDRSRAATE